MTAALARIVISVASLEAALPLYEKVLDLRRLQESPGLVVLALARGTELVLHERASAGSAGSAGSADSAQDAGVSPIFRVANVDATVKGALGAGATVIDAPTDQAWGEREAVLHDVDGHVLSIVTPI